MVHRMQYTTLLKSRIKYNNVNERNQIRVRPHIQNVHQNAYSRHISPVQADFSLSLLFHFNNSTYFFVCLLYLPPHYINHDHGVCVRALEHRSTVIIKNYCKQAQSKLRMDKRTLTHYRQNETKTSNNNNKTKLQQLVAFQPINKHTNYSLSGIWNKDDEKNTKLQTKKNMMMMKITNNQQQHAIQKRYIDMKLPSH